MSRKTNLQTPTKRKLLAFLNDDEWRALRVKAAENDTTIQGYVTNVILRDLTNSKPRR